MTTFFDSKRQFRAKLKASTNSARGIMVGFRSRPNGHACLAIDEAQAEALIVGWCSGRRTVIDSTTFAIQFSPRKPGAVWTAADIAIAEDLIARGEMSAVGVAAYESRAQGKSNASTGGLTMSPLMLSELKRHAAAWTHFQKLSPSHRQRWTDWVMGAKQEKTRSDRFARLLMDLSRPRR